MNKNAGIFLVFLGVLVMMGWFFGIDRLIQINPNWVPMQFNTALLFVLCGIGCFYKRALYLVLLVAGLTFSQDLTGLSLGIDELLMESHISVQTPNPGRMAIPTSLCFIMLSCSMLMRKFGHVPLALVVLASGFSLIGYAAGLETYRWFGQTSMAMHTALGFAVTGLLFYLSNIQKELILTKEMAMKVSENEKELMKSNKDLTQFAYVAAHDLKSPIRGIINLSEWLEEELEEADVSDDAREYMRLIHGRAKRMHNLIDGLLEYSKVGHQDNPKMLCMNALIDEINDSYDDVNITRSSLPNVVYDEHLMKQVLANLTSNAINHNDQHPMRIHWSCEESDTEYKFCIEDNGPGIEPQYQEKIFEIFQTLKPKDDHESTGIGLTIVKKIIDNSEGRVWYEPQDQGVRFYFTVSK